MSKTFKDRNNRVEDPRRRREDDYAEERHKVKQLLNDVVRRNGIGKETVVTDEYDYEIIGFDEDMEAELEQYG